MLSFAGLLFYLKNGQLATAVFWGDYLTLVDNVGTKRRLNRLSRSSSTNGSSLTGLKWAVMGSHRANKVQDE